MKSYANVATSSGTWEVVLTDWAVQSYLDLKHQQTFTDHEYWSVIRPDVERLKPGWPPSDPKFALPKFWSPATVGGQVLPNGYKMKWHQVGAGLVQLRLPVMITPTAALLCEAYVKKTRQQEARMLLKFMSHMNLIALGKFVKRGRL